MALGVGELEYVSGVGPGSVSGTLAGISSRAVWVVSNRILHAVVAQPELKSLHDLRGKKIGVTGLGGTAHVALQIALEAVHENSKNFLYVSITAAALMAALESGVVDAALTSPLSDFYAKRKSFREVLNAGSYARMPFGGLTRDAFTLRSRADEVKKVMRAMQVAKQEMLKSKQKTVG